MPTKPQGCIIEPRKSKSLYTAVLYDNVSESCASSSTGEVGPCSSYLKRITREHLARASMEEVESSASGSPSPESKERVAQLTEKVRRAYTEVNGNPADGRWSFVAGLLRLSTTRGGRRWLGVNTATEAPEIPKHLCVIPKTSEEWHELERKWKEEEDVKNKVQRWIVTAEFEPLTPETTVIQKPAEGEELSSLKSNRKPSGNSSRKLTTQTTLEKFSTLTDPLSSGSKLGFSVVKRSNTIASDKPKPRKVQALLSSPHATSTPPSPLDRGGGAVPERNPSTTGEQNQIPVVDRGNLSTHEFLPPSFSLYQVQTSTPLPGRVNNARKPSLIPLVESLSLPSPVSSPKPMKTYGKPRNMLLASPPSLDPEPFSPQPQGGVTDVTRKRSRSPSLVEGPATKRARLLVDKGAGADHTSFQLPLQLPPSRNSIDGSPDVTPKKNLPRLKELLASAKHSRDEALRKKRSSKAHAELPTASTGASGSGSGLNPLKAVTVGEPATVTTSIHDPELALHDSSPGSACALGLSAEVAEVEAEVMIPNIDTKLAPYDAESSSNALLHDDLNGTMSDEPSTQDPALHDRVTLGSCPQTASEAGSQPDTTVEKALAWNESQPLSPVLPESPDANSFRIPSADPDSLPSTHGVTAYNLYGLDAFDNPSPTKSLSSLANADSESDSDREEGERTGINLSNSLHLLDSEFQPQFTSTQKPYTGLNTDLPAAVLGSSLPSDSLAWGNEKLVSTSQLRAEVSSQVDELDKFMEADLGYDFVIPG